MVVARLRTGAQRRPDQATRQGTGEPEQRPARRAAARRARAPRAHPRHVRRSQPSCRSGAEYFSKRKADLALLKPGSPVSSEQRQQFIKDLAIAARTTKPSLPTVTKLVDTLAAALGENILGEAEQERLALNLNSVFNSKPLPAAQFDAIIADVQAILQVGGVKRPAAPVLPAISKPWARKCAANARP